ncbi:unnamed protein product [Penicillium manginii]
MTDNSTFPFTVTEHVVDAQHIREYPNATRRRDASLKLILKQYTPIDNPSPQAGDITIIGAHGCGFPKELYEPLWEDLHTRGQVDGYRIRSIWIADVVSLGASGIRNEDSLGNDREYSIPQFPPVAPVADILESILDGSQPRPPTHDQYLSRPNATADRGSGT